MSTILANNLKKFRLQKNLTQEQASEILDVSTHTISRWECSTTLPDVTLLPEIARLYCITIDDLFKETSVAYENYAQRLASVYEATREPEDFIRADLEFKKLLKTGNYSTEDLRTYGILHHFMMRYCISNAVDLFDKVIEKGEDAGKDIFWRTRQQKISLYSQIGRSQENIDSALEIINRGGEKAEDWICLIDSYWCSGNTQKAYDSFLKAVKKFPDNASLYIYGGDACKSLGRYDEAFSYWDKALELDDTFIDAKYSKAFYYEETGAYEYAYKMWCEIIEELKRNGFDVEAASDEKRAQEYWEKMNK